MIDRIKQITGIPFINNEKQRKEFLDMQAHKAYIYYKNDHLGILHYLKMHLQSIISDDAVIERMPKVYINDIPKLVKRLALVYTDRPEREYSSKLSEDVEYIINRTHRFYKEFHRQAKLLNTILVRPIWKEDHFDFMVLGRQFATVIPTQDDHNTAEEVQYKRDVMLNNELEEITFHWTNEEYWATDSHGNDINPSKLPGILTKDGRNPYKRNPFVKLQLESSNDYWGDGIPDVINMAEVYNGKLTDAYYKQWLSFGHPIGTNLGITADQYVVAPYKPFMVNNAKNDEIAPNLEFKTPNHLVEDDKDLIDWTRKTGGTSKGLSASNFSDEEKDLSGYAKTIDNLELIELNKDDTEALTEFEYELFDMIKLEGELNGVSIKADLVNVRLQEYEFPKSTEEIWKEREFEYKYNLATPVDWMKEKYPTMTDKEIEDRLKENKERKTLFGDSSSAVQSLLQRRNATQNNPQT